MAAPIVSIGLADLTRMIIHPDISGKQIRKAWEVSSPTTQCNRLIGPSTEETKCYICGMLVEKTVPNTGQNNNNNSDSESKDGLNPECEHILPIAETIIYLGLESPQFANNPWYLGQDKLRQEYAWAHRTCNQIKSDESFIGRNKEGIFVVKIKELEDLLKRIWRTERKDSKKTFVPKLHKEYTTERNFINKRIGDKSFIGRFQVICDYLNEFKAPNLLLLSGLAGLVNTTGPKSKSAREAQATRSPYNYKRIQEEKLALEVRNRAVIYDKIVTYVIQKINPILHPSVREQVFGEFKTFVDEKKDTLIQISFEICL